LKKKQNIKYHYEFIKILGEINNRFVFFPFSLSRHFCFAVARSLITSVLRHTHRDGRKIATRELIARHMLSLV